MGMTTQSGKSSRTSFKTCDDQLSQCTQRRNDMGVLVGQFDANVLPKNVVIMKYPFNAS
jgi:hypothetical protein